MSERFRDESGRTELELNGDATFRYDVVSRGVHIWGRWVRRGRWLHLDGSGRAPFVRCRTGYIAPENRDFRARFLWAADGSIAMDWIDRGWGILRGWGNWETPDLRLVPVGQPRLHEELEAPRRPPTTKDVAEALQRIIDEDEPRRKRRPPEPRRRPGEADADEGRDGGGEQ